MGSLLENLRGSRQTSRSKSRMAAGKSRKASKVTAKTYVKKAGRRGGGR